MSKDVFNMYQKYWKSKEGLEDFEDYERNDILRKLFTRGESVIDIASGEGAVSQFLQSLGCDVVAFDISKEALKKAAQRGVKTVLGNVEQRFPFKDAQFDSAFWGDNVEHLFLPQKTLKEINRILKPGGKLIISCPNMGYWRYRLTFLFTGMIPNSEWHSQIPWEWEHIRFFNKRIMEEFLKSEGFSMKIFFGISRRRLDQPLKSFFPSLFGMIMVIEAVKND